MTDIRVVSRTQRIEVAFPPTQIGLNPAKPSVTIVNAGPIGPPGIQGEGGGVSSPSYQHIQLVATTSWVINHNLGFRPNVSVFDDNGANVEATIIHHSINQAEVQLLTPRAGTARLS